MIVLVHSCVSVWQTTYRSLRQHRFTPYWPSYWPPGHLMLTSGSFHTDHWVILYWPPGHLMLTTGSSCTDHWVISYWPPGHLMLATWSSHAHHWVILYWPLGHLILTTGSFCTDHWVISYWPLGHLILTSDQPLIWDCPFSHIGTSVLQHLSCSLSHCSYSVDSVL